jgi:hypothetical protein
MPKAEEKAPDDLLLTKVEVARTLCVTLGAVNKMIAQGILQSCNPAGAKPMFHISDVAEVLKVVEDRVHLSKIYNRALTAYAVGKRVERKLDEVLDLFGAKERRLPEDPYDIEAMYRRVANALKSDLRTLTAVEVMDWAKVFLSVDETYLILAAHFMKTQEPWLHFIMLGQQMVSKAPRDFFHAQKDLEVAYAYFSFALRSMRQAAYFFCRLRDGAAEANKAFPEARDGDVTRGISHLVRIAMKEDIRLKLDSEASSHKRKWVRVDSKRVH